MGNTHAAGVQASNLSDDELQRIARDMYRGLRRQGNISTKAVSGKLYPNAAKSKDMVRRVTSVSTSEFVMLQIK